MVEPGQGPRSGTRDNGLRCAGYVPIGDLDPRVADALLETLRTEGIAAYVAPTPAARGSNLEVTQAPRLTDRLYADASHANRAGELFAAVPSELASETAQTAETAVESTTTAEPAMVGDSEIDFESAWQQLLGSLQSSATTPTPAWPDSTGLDPGTQVPVGLRSDVASGGPTGGDPAMDEHFVPPPPPPLPRLRRVTVLALLAIVGGLIVLGTGVEGGSLDWLAVLAILGGGAALIYHVKEGPPTDSGWDDGAVV
jgi:hypothetical protein